MSKVVLTDRYNNIELAKTAPVIVVMLCNGDDVNVIASGDITEKYLTRLSHNSKKIIKQLIKENFKHGRR